VNVNVLECSLVSNKNLSEILPCSGLGTGPDKVDQKGLKVLMTSLTKKQKTKNFFIANSKTCQVF